MDIALLILTAICALTGFICAVPIVKSWLQSRAKGTPVTGEARFRRAAILSMFLSSFAFIFSVIGLYRVIVKPKIMTVTISAYTPQYPAPMRVVKDQTFENTDVPLDGYDYDHVTFTNVCFLYEGGSYELQEVTLKEKWHICSADERLRNLQALWKAFNLLDPRTTLSTRTIIKRP